MPRLGLSPVMPLIAAAALIGWGTIDAAAAEASPSATQIVSYQGLHFTVPLSWPVINLTAGSTTCVRFDRHAVYLGAPGAAQNCPATVVGRTEALLVQPDSAPATTPTDNPVAHEITAISSGVRITATYGQDETVVRQILTSAALPAPTVRREMPSTLQPFASTTTLSTEYTGSGFDTCTAPSASAMSTWLSASPYRAIGIYIGGSDRGCAQPNLTASWVSQQVAAGWHFQPLYVGPQANGEITAPASQAVAAADDAVNQAAALGFGPGSLLYYDMEAYQSAQSSTAVAFMSAWTTELHAKGYQSGIYSSMNSGVADLLNNYTNTSFTEPDVLFFAHIPGSGATTSDPEVPANEWANHQRAHQYGLGNSETYGGVTMNVDDNYLDVELGCGGPSGSVLARSDIGYCGWTQESSPGIRAISVGSDGTQMILGDDGTVYAKNSIGLYGWTQESSPGSRAIATNDGVQMIIDSNGDVDAKNSIGLYGWTMESSPGSTAISVGSDGTQMIIDSNGDVDAKNSIGLYGWTVESSPGSRAIAANGGVQMIIDSNGDVDAKNSIGLYGWTQESSPGSTAISVGSDGTQMIIDSNGDVDAKNSIGLYGWTVESSPGSRAIATSGGIQMIIDSTGSVDAKNSIGLYGWTKEADPSQAIAVGGDGTQAILG
jgi:hypothetical protein